jgi:hypothetical protein
MRSRIVEVAESRGVFSKTLVSRSSTSEFEHAVYTFAKKYGLLNLTERVIYDLENQLHGTPHRIKKHDIDVVFLCAYLSGSPLLVNESIPIRLARRLMRWVHIVESCVDIEYLTLRIAAKTCDVTVQTICSVFGGSTELKTIIKDIKR